MRRPRSKAITALGVVGALLLAIVLVVGRESAPKYQVRLELDNASGLRKGSRVSIAGANVGKVANLSIGSTDKVRVLLELEKGHPLGRGASATIKATNLLATKTVDLAPGDVKDPAPSGVVIPGSRTTESVDVDQVVDVLDADTRTRLGILINEAGFAMTGRRADFNTLVGRLPATLDDATRLLGEISSDRRTLGRLIESSDQFLAELDPQRRQLSDLVRAAGGTMTTVSARRSELRATLARAPRALATLRRFLVDLRTTTVPLGPAARALDDSAPALAATLKELAPFERNARPTLKAARTTAPALTRLGTGATPVINDAIPTLRSLTAFAADLAPTSKTLARGGTGGVKEQTAPGAIDDLLGTATSWASGASDRDQAGHIFHGILTIGSDTLLDAVKSWSKAITSPAPAADARQRASGNKGPAQTRTPDRRTPAPVPNPTPAPAPTPDAAPREKPGATVVPPLVKKLDQGVSDILDSLLKP